MDRGAMPGPEWVESSEIASTKQPPEVQPDRAPPWAFVALLQAVGELSRPQLGNGQTYTVKQRPQRVDQKRTQETSGLLPWILEGGPKSPLEQ